MHAAADAAAAPAPVFVVSEVLNASGGRTGCFLYRGTLACAALRSRTPALCCPWPRAAGGAAGAAPHEQRPAGEPEADLPEDAATDLAAYEGQQLTLYMAYEEASPKMRQRQRAGAGGAPWRLALRDAADQLVFCARGLPRQVRAPSVCARSLAERAARAQDRCRRC